MRRIAFSFSMTPLMNSPSARRSEGGRKGGLEETPNTCQGEGLEGVGGGFLGNHSRTAGVYVATACATRAYRGDLSLGGFMAPIVIKPNS